VLDERLSAVESNTIVTIEKKPWLRSEHAASLLRLVFVVAVHGAVIAALLSWSWLPAPIEVSILSLEDLGGEVPASQDVPAQERSTPDVEAAAPANDMLPTAVAPALEPAQPQQIDIALSQRVPPAPEPQVAPELVPEQLPVARLLTKLRSRRLHLLQLLRRLHRMHRHHPPQHTHRLKHPR
jgi:hypothetical protein